MISQTSDYAIRAVIVLAGEYNRQPLRAEVVADATGAPRNYMGKTLNALVKAGVLKSARGPQGESSTALSSPGLIRGAFWETDRVMPPTHALLTRSGRRSTRAVANHLPLLPSPISSAEPANR
jgi:hypothetical protein